MHTPLSLSLMERRAYAVLASSELPPSHQPRPPLNAMGPARLPGCNTQAYAAWTTNKSRGSRTFLGGVAASSRQGSGSLAQIEGGKRYSLHLPCHLRLLTTVPIFDFFLTYTSVFQPNSWWVYPEGHSGPTAWSQILFFLRSPRYLPCIAYRAQHSTAMYRYQVCLT